jgi:hypothetical protein
MRVTGRLWMRKILFEGRQGPEQTAKVLLAAISDVARSCCNAGCREEGQLPETEGAGESGDKAG